MNRRTFLSAAAGAVVLPAATTLPSSVIDTHAHFYDPSRAQGVPWPSKTETLLYRTVLPDEFVRVTKPFGVTGVIKVEASAWLEDNQWVLDLAAKNPVIVGSVGHLEPGTPDFRKNLERFHKNRLFRGIRLGKIQDGPEFLADLKQMAGAGLELDAIGPPALLAQLVRLTDHVPNLRVVINHMPFDAPKDEEPRKAYQAAMAELGRRPQVYSKVSGVLRNVNGRVPDDAAYYRPALDELWNAFGADRLVYGSNWPVSEKIAPYSTVFKVVREYFSSKGQEATDKYFWKNSKAAYRW
ncbi:MAG: amidohydrolase family protein [Bryobacteraceae bacterium]